MIPFWSSEKVGEKGFDGNVSIEREKVFFAREILREADFTDWQLYKNVGRFHFWCRAKDSQQEVNLSLKMISYRTKPHILRKSPFCAIVNLGNKK